MNLVPQYGGTVGGFRRSVVLSWGGFDPYVLAEDTDLTFRLLVRGWRAAYANKVEGYEEAAPTWGARLPPLRRGGRGHEQGRVLRGGAPDLGRALPAAPAVGARSHPDDVPALAPCADLAEHDAGAARRWDAAARHLHDPAAHPYRPRPIARAVHHRNDPARGHASAVVLRGGLQRVRQLRALLPGGHRRGARRHEGAPVPAPLPVLHVPVQLLGRHARSVRRGRRRLGRASSDLGEDREVPAVKVAILVGLGALLLARPFLPRPR